jgi:hypothetical protein
MHENMYLKYVFPLLFITGCRGKKGNVPMHAIKAYGRVEVQLHSFLTLSPDGGELSALSPGCFTAGEKPPVHIE